MLDTVRRTIRRYQLLQADSRVVVAVSGGADSVALLLILRDLASEGECAVAGVAHLNHQLRGREADEDEAFCAQLAAAHQLAFVSERVDVRALAEDSGLSIEAAAHRARQDFFGRAAASLSGDVVAVGHTRDDQAETFLLRLIRGAGPRGLGGMHPRSGLVIRPLIECSRSDLRDFLASRGGEHREDESNADLEVPRNRIRHELIPFLRERFSPAIVEVLEREARIAREDNAFLEEAARRAAAKLLRHTAEGVEIDAAGLLSEPPAVARRLIRGAQETASGGRFMGFEAVDAVLAFAVSKSLGPLDLPGHRANRRGETIVLTKSRGRPKRREHAEFVYELGVPGLVSIPEADCSISASVEPIMSRESAARWAVTSRGDQAVVEAGQVVGPLTVRNRRPGDKFRPLGLSGHKKLQDYFVDAKVRRSDRDRVPLVVDSAGQIVWVAGHVVAEDFRVTDRTRAVVILKRVPV